MGISFETINNRLGYDFLQSVREYCDNINTEYDGKRPIDNLTEEELEFYEAYILQRIEDGHKTL